MLNYSIKRGYIPSVLSAVTAFPRQIQMAQTVAGLDPPFNSAPARVTVK